MARIKVEIELDVDMDAQAAANNVHITRQFVQTLRDLRDLRRWQHAVDSHTTVKSATVVLDLFPGGTVPVPAGWDKV